MHCYNPRLTKIKLQLEAEQGNITTTYICENYSLNAEFVYI